MNKKPVETILGFIVLIVAILFLNFAYSVADLQVVKGYNVNAKFLKVGGLSTGSDVMISGIKVGTVTSQSLNKEEYVAEISMSIAPEVKLPTDTVAEIVSAGLMGDKYVKLIPGNEEEFLEDGDEISKTNDYKSLEDSVGEIIFMVTED